MESAHIIYGLVSTCTNNGKEMRGAVLVRCEDVGNGENEHTHLLANAHHLGGGIIGRGRRLIGRLIGLLIIALRVRVLLIVLVHLVLPLFLKNVQNSAPIAYHIGH